MDVTAQVQEIEAGGRRLLCGGATISAVFRVPSGVLAHAGPDPDVLQGHALSSAGVTPLAFLMAGASLEPTALDWVCRGSEIAMSLGDGSSLLAAGAPDEITFGLAPALDSWGSSEAPRQAAVLTRRRDGSWECLSTCRGRAARHLRGLDAAAAHAAAAAHVSPDFRPVRAARAGGTFPGLGPSVPAGDVAEWILAFEPRSAAPAPSGQDAQARALRRALSRHARRVLQAAPGLVAMPAAWDPGGPPCPVLAGRGPRLALDALARGGLLHPSAAPRPGAAGLPVPARAVVVRPRSPYRPARIQ